MASLKKLAKLKKEELNKRSNFCDCQNCYKMEGNQAISSPLFDFSDFCEKEFLTDCELITKNPEGSQISTIRAHKVVLANSANYFLDAFTSGMEETVTGKVDILLNTKDDTLFRKVLHWMYTGSIDFAELEFIPILHIVRYFGVHSLEKQLQDYLSLKINPDNILTYVNQCYELQFPSELQLFVPYLAQYFDQIHMSELSKSLDVRTFCQVIKEKDFGVEQRIKIISQFMSGYKPLDQEKKELAKALDLTTLNAELKDLIKKYDVDWLPDDILRAAK